MFFILLRVITVTIAMFLLTTSAFARDNLGSRESSGEPENVTLAETFGSDPSPIINWPTFYGVQQTGMINATFDCFGLFTQYSDLWNHTVAGWPIASFETPPGNGQEYLFHGCFWIGGIVDGDTLVSTGLDGWSASGHEYFPKNYPERGSITEFDYTTDYSMRAVFADTMTEGVEPDFWLGRPHIPLNIKVSCRSHTWHSGDCQDFILYDVVITNLGGELIEKAYVGLFADADAYWEGNPSGYTDDVAGSIKDEGIGYIIDNNGDPVAGGFDSTTSLQKCFAVKLLGSSRSIANANFNWWVSNGDATKDFGPRRKGTAQDPYFDFGTGGLGTPEGDINKYYMLSHKEWDYDQVYTASIGENDPHWLYPNQAIAADLSDGTDTKFLMSYGPVNLEPGASWRIQLAMVSGEYIHTLAANGNNLPLNPDEYLANLTFDNLIHRSGLAEEKAVELFDPMQPPIGLEVVHQDWDNVTIEWDPWVLDNIDGCNIYLGEIPNQDIPYPGVVPPWLTLDDVDLQASLDEQTSYTFTRLRQGLVYYVRLAHRSSATIGQMSSPALIDYRVQDPPLVGKTAVYYSPDCPNGAAACSRFPTLTWSPPKEVNVDFYNIYRLANSAELAGKYYPFYDQGEHLGILQPKDTIEVNGVTYYFYGMDTYAVVGKDAHTYTDNEPLDGAYYIITAVDKNGCETRFSDPVQAFAIENFSKDFVVFTRLNAYWSAKDSVKAFYEDVLEGYDYDIYSVSDTAFKYNCASNLHECINWQDFTNYKVMILDEDIWSPFFTEGFESKSNAVTNYLLSGGMLLYFGGFEGFIDMDYRTAEAYPADYDFIKRFFGIDNIYQYGLGFYGLPFPCAQALDTCFGFNSAEATVASLPVVNYDMSRNAFRSMITCYWNPETPPSVATFGVSNAGRTIHLFRSLYPLISWIEGDPVGVKTLTNEAETYLFGFRPWYMERGSFRNLLNAFSKNPSFDGTAKDPAGGAQSFVLNQNYPNPFNPSTIITFTLPQACPVRLRVYNILGQQVKELVNTESLSAGVHRVEWHGDNTDGDKVSSGVYFYRLEAGDQVASKTMILLK